MTKHTVFVSLAQPVGFALENTSSTTAEDVRLDISVDDPEEDLAFFDEDDVPEEPDSRSITVRMNFGPRTRVEHDLLVRRTGTSWQITGRFGKVQPKATVYLRSRLYVGAYKNTTLTLDALLFADNLPTPQHVPLTLDITSAERTVTMNEIQRLHAKWFLNSPRGQAFQKEQEKKKR